MTVLRERVTVSAGALEISVKLTILDCASCGVIFAIPDDLSAKRRKDGASFFCPNGHSLSYGEGEAERLRQQLKHAENRARWAEDSETLQRQRATRAEASLRTTRGHVTRLRNRAHAGTCPFGCRRHFADLERHVASKHAGERLEGES